MLDRFFTANGRHHRMDWTLAIARNLASLRQIAATMAAMAGLGGGDAQGSSLGSQPVTLPRLLHTALLGILRPAEAALRRLIVIAARDIVVTLSPAERARLAGPAASPPISRTGIFWYGRPAGPEDLARLEHLGRASGETASAAPTIAPGSGVGDGPNRAESPRAPCFCLFDPLKRFGVHRQGPSQWVPRILFDLDAPPTLPAHKPASPDDPVGAAQLCRRIAGLTAALDDLPGQARRLARWRARRKLRQGARGRLSPLRPGSPPGHSNQADRPVDDVLHRCHGLAIDLAMRRDTS